jgi:recyclin-1
VSSTPLVPFSLPSPFLLSLDLALNLIHLSRSSLKRVESFSGSPGHYGTHVRDTTEEGVIALFLTLGERYVVRGFDE